MSGGGKEFEDIRNVVDSSVKWDTLANVETDAEFIYNNKAEEHDKICVLTDSEFYGFYDMPIYFYDNGNVSFLYFGHSYIFNIGEEGYKEIYNLVRGE